MDILSTLKDIGLSVLSKHPLGAIATSVINEFLPGDEQLPEHATGHDALARIDQLAPDQKFALLSKKVDLEIQQEKSDADKYASMCQADGQETRARIVNKAMNALITISIIFIVATAYVYSTEGATKAFSFEMSTCFLSITGTFAFVIRAYFGDLRSETESRHFAHNNQPQQTKGLAGIIQAIKQ